MRSAGSPTRLLAPSLVTVVACLAATAAGFGAEVRVFDIASPPTSADAVGRAVASAADNGFDTVVAPLPLTTETRDTAAFDPFAELVRLAALRGLRVHGLVTVGLATTAGELPLARDHVVYQHPEWLMVPRALAPELSRLDPRSPAYLGRLLRWARSNAAAGLQLSPAYPDTATYLAAALARALQRYAVDELTLDLRLPAADFDFSLRAVDHFAATVRPTLSQRDRLRMEEVEAIDPSAWADEYPAEWARFHRERSESLLDRLRRVATSERPGTIINARVSGSEITPVFSGVAGSR